MQRTRDRVERTPFFFRQCEIFKHLSPAELQQIDERCPDRSLKAGELVFASRDDASALYVLKRGRVKMVRTSSEGSVRIEDVLFPGDVFGLFFDQAESDLSEVDLHAEALIDTIVCAIDRSIIEDLILENPRTALSFTRALVDRLRESQRRLDRLYFDSSRSRLAKYLLDLAREHGRSDGDRVHLELPLNQEELGELIGASRVTVNQLLGEFRREGVAHMSRGALSLDPERLRSMI